MLRFSSARSIGQLSKWLRPHVRPDESFAEMQSQLGRFFARHQEHHSRVQAAKGWGGGGAAQIPPSALKSSAYPALGHMQDSIREAREFFGSLARGDALSSTDVSSRSLAAQLYGRSGLAGNSCRRWHSRAASGGGWTSTEGGFPNPQEGPFAPRRHGAKVRAPTAGQGLSRKGNNTHSFWPAPALFTN